MKKYSCSVRPIIVSLATLLIPVLMTAQPMSVFDYLAVQDVSEVTITTDLTNLLELQGEEDQKAVLSFVNSENVTEEWDIKVSARGKFRRRVCEFPPIKLDFSKGDLKNRGFAEFDKYKVVTHCQENRREAKEAVLREYTTYQLYNALTPSSYEAYLLQINYVDSKGEVNNLRRYAFILESTQELAARLAVKECEDCRGYTPDQVELPAENMLAVFQYMIGNTDFNLSMVRNLKLFSNSEGKAIPVAYDFDFSAMVSVPYAIPARELGQTSIEDRVFLGFQVADQLMEETLAHFEKTREELEQIIKSQRALSSAARLEMRTYLDEFYAHLTDLRELGKVRTYSQMRQTAPLVVPAGAKPEDYGVRR
ncbi:MAG: hypothetical protein ACRBG0_18020 [Lewinella sp.]|jgi:hypothetical protein|uniref:hypothetical protein n=1 Tax=Lewinella sp. TaxID=2004506 RepID=UPI003D6B0D41